VRLFVALEIPVAVRDNLAALVRELSKLPSQAVGKPPRWVRPENLHVTLKFVGETAGVTLDAIRDALAGIRANKPIDIKCQGLGFFPDEGCPQVLWAGLDASANLPRLADDVDRALETVGVAREKRAFTPHLTLARFDPPRLPEKLHDAITEAAARDFGAFQGREFHLIESKTKPSGAEYTTLHSFAFLAEA
jgi:RNA 2',3'-cyclic 3'-phosphodiesterase